MREINKLISQMESLGLESWAERLETQVDSALSVEANAKTPEWQKVVSELPVLEAAEIELKDAVRVASAVGVDETQQEELKQQLKALMPWRKGPYELHGVTIDTEWRSDFKWQRLIKAIKPLEGRVILDVGCGNGYHGWRMLGEGAELVIGVDPSPLFYMQFNAVKHFIGDKNIFLLPVGIEAVPDNLQAFDSVFSMGVLYHRRSPIDHLYQLRQCLKPGGQLILETLVIEGDERQVLLPEDRYAQMRNVWFLPSSKAMLLWLQRCGFKNIKLVDESYTSLDEQRSTEWMQFHSLKEFLDADDLEKTVEGYPAPLRAIFTADAP